MTTEHIDFISSYCDRWCERCAFTDRCAVYACQIAIEMCGDVSAGLELAIGSPRVPDHDHREPNRPWLADLASLKLSAVELRAAARAERKRRKRIDAHPLAALAHEFAMTAMVWLRDRAEGLQAGADPVLSEALEVAMHDALFIGAKLHRAVDGRDRWQAGEADGETLLGQKDWDGSAKVALISIERSRAAWQTIAAAADDVAAHAIAERLDRLQHMTRREFPRAMDFIRPGFDEPAR